MELIQETKFKSPFNDYEIFWYIIPGASLLMSIFLFEFWVVKEIANIQFHAPLYTSIIKTCIHLFSANWVVSVLYLLALLSIAYVAGHITSSISTILIERLLVQKAYEYPYVSLLNLKNQTHRENISKTFYKGLFFWVNLYLVLRYVFSFFPQLIWVKLVIVITEYSIIIAFVIKLLYNPLRDKLFNRLGFWSSISHTRFISFAIKIVLNCYTFFFPLGYNLASRFLSKYLHTQRPFDIDFIILYKKFFQNLFGLDSNVCAKQNFWLSRFYVLEESRELSKEIFIWENICRFSRNLSIAFFIAFLYTYFSLYYQHFNIGNNHESMVAIMLPLLYYMLSILMLIYYIYLYDNKYTRLVFRTFVCLNAIKTK